MDLNFSLWLFPPLIIGILPYVLTWTLGQEFYDKFLFHETGIIENLTILFLCSSLILCLSIYRKRSCFSSPFIGWFFMVIFLGSFYFVGEEASWGQHFFHWQSPHFLTQMNNQNETNFHNIHSVFDQLPRTLLTVGTVLAGLIIPLLVKLKVIRLNARSILTWACPTYVGAPTALMVIGLSLMKKMKPTMEYYDLSGELKECLLGFFIFLYCASFYKRFIRVNEEKTSETEILSMHS